MNVVLKSTGENSVCRRQILFVGMNSSKCVYRTLTVQAQKALVTIHHCPGVTKKPDKRICLRTMGTKQAMMLATNFLKATAHHSQEMGIGAEDRAIRLQLNQSHGAP